MTIGFNTFVIDGNTLTIEIVDHVLDNNYNCIGEQEGYTIYRKDEEIKDDVHHYYLAKKECQTEKNCCNHK